MDSTQCLLLSLEVFPYADCSSLQLKAQKFNLSCAPDSLPEIDLHAIVHQNLEDVVCNLEHIPRGLASDDYIICVVDCLCTPEDGRYCLVEEYRTLAPPLWKTGPGVSFSAPLECESSLQLIIYGHTEKSVLEIHLHVVFPFVV